MPTWGFYGRADELAELGRMVRAQRWFFCRLEGRRRIGETTLLSQLAKSIPELESRLIYMQVPDSDERDVAVTLRRAIEDCDHELPRALAGSVVDFATMAHAIGQLCQAGFFVVLDEFQYFTRAKLRAFNSFLQAQVDELRNLALPHGGLFVLGSLQSEMNALLDDQAAPLYGRTFIVGWFSTAPRPAGLALGAVLPKGSASHVQRRLPAVSSSARGVSK